MHRISFIWTPVPRSVARPRQIRANRNPNELAATAAGTTSPQVDPSVTRSACRSFAGHEQAQHGCRIHALLVRSYEGGQGSAGGEPTAEDRHGCPEDERRAQHRGGGGERTEGGYGERDQAHVPESGDRGDA